MKYVFGFLEPFFPRSALNLAKSANIGKKKDFFFSKIPLGYHKSQKFNAKQKRFSQEQIRNEHQTLRFLIPHIAFLKNYFFYHSCTFSKLEVKRGRKKRKT
jgi:hypothetical protein